MLNEFRLISLVSSCFIMTSVFLRRPLLWSVGRTLQRKRRWSFVLRPLCLPPGNEKERLWRERDGRKDAYTKREKLISRVRAYQNEGATTCFAFVKLRKAGEETEHTQHLCRSHFVMELLRWNILNFPT
jgi:hypothetical protein